MKVSKSKIELNEQFVRALDTMEKDMRSVFITGRAGTGKSTLLGLFRDITKKNVVILAPTGVAALNVKGQTIHSFFGFKPGITPEQITRRRFNTKRNIYSKLDTIVIDEISMVRADLLDCIDRFMRLNGPDFNSPFGSVQMAFIGDLYQLPPVVTREEQPAFNSIYETPYFYGAKVFDSFSMEFVELEKVYRQHDEQFITLLNSIRDNSITREGLDLLNQRCQPDFEPPSGEFYIYLTTTNRLADEINQRRLAEQKGRVHSYTGKITENFGKEYFPTAVELEVKVGAQVMLLNNDAQGRWVNGSVGKIIQVTHMGSTDDIIVARLTDGEEVDITPFTWEISRYYLEQGKLQSEVIGSFTQYPLMLAWAVTIHKSQGKTFEHVIINIGSGTFAQGQIYVALSRCKTLDGIVLKEPILKQHIWFNHTVTDFLREQKRENVNLYKRGRNR